MLSKQDEEIGSSWGYPKANILNRFIAKFIDFLIVAAIFQIPLEISFLAALAYLLIADGFANGRSPGKQLIGLQVVLPDPLRGISFKESIIRNIPLGVGFLFSHIPVIGWLLVLLIVGFESLLIIGNTKGYRIGDELAKTQVLDQMTPEPLKK
ncbi:MAG: RDD family protein [Nitrospiria bacterium]